jgi:hypothetical protein
VKTRVQRVRVRGREAFSSLGYRPMTVGPRPALKFSEPHGPTSSRRGSTPLRIFRLGLLSQPERSQHDPEACGSALTGRSSSPQDASQPVKRRRAMLASNPLRNNRSKTHRSDEGAALGVAPLLDRCDRSSMPQKRQAPPGKNPLDGCYLPPTENTLFLLALTLVENLFSQEVKP